MNAPGRTRRVISFGIYSKRPEYPRHRNLVAGLEARGVEVLECHYAMESTFGERLRSSATAAGGIGFAFKLLRSRIELARRFRALPQADAVLVGYPSLFHVRLARRLAARRMPAARIVADVFAPVYETVVVDRGLKPPTSPAARLLYALERRACTAADVCLLDTDTHADYVAREFRLPREKMARVLVGSLFPPYPAPPPLKPANKPFTVLFVGTFIPLQGVETVVEAAQRLGERRDIRFVLVGEGQTRAQVEALVRRWQLPNVELRGWIDPAQMGPLMRSYSVSLGIFGTGAKAARVVPHKVFDACAAGVPVVTADSAAARELLVDGESALLVPAGDGEALAHAISRLEADEALRAVLATAGLKLARERMVPERLEFGWLEAGRDPAADAQA